MEFQFIQHKIQEIVNKNVLSSHPMTDFDEGRISALTWVQGQLEEPCLHGDSAENEGLLHLITRLEFEEFKGQSCKMLREVKKANKDLEARFSNLYLRTVETLGLGDDKITDICQTLAVVNERLEKLEEEKS